MAASTVSAGKRDRDRHQRVGDRRARRWRGLVAREPPPAARVRAPSHARYASICDERRENRRSAQLGAAFEAFGEAPRRRTAAGPGDDIERRIADGPGRAEQRDLPHRTRRAPGVSNIPSGRPADSMESRPAAYRARSSIFASGTAQRANGIPSPRMTPGIRPGRPITGDRREERRARRIPPAAIVTGDASKPEAVPRRLPAWREQHQRTPPPRSTAVRRTQSLRAPARRFAAVTEMHAEKYGGGVRDSPATGVHGGRARATANAPASRLTRRHPAWPRARGRRSDGHAGDPASAIGCTRTARRHEDPESMRSRFRIPSRLSAIRRCEHPRTAREQQPEECRSAADTPTPGTPAIRAVGAHEREQQRGVLSRERLPTRRPPIAEARTR